MHGGEHHPDPSDPPFVKPSFIGTNRAIRYPVRFRAGNQVRCANNGHAFTFTETHVFASEEELQTYVCDCVEQNGDPLVPVTAPAPHK
jgi:hypothetical protein